MNSIKAGGGRGAFVVRRRGGAPPTAWAHATKKMPPWHKENEQSSLGLNPLITICAFTLSLKAG
jgi:hypothetical protein